MKFHVARGMLMLVLAVTVGLFVAQAVQAADPTFTPNVPIPGLFPENGKTSEPIDANIAGRYIRALYIYFISIVGVLAVVMIMYAGFLWITAAGNSSRITEAKEHMNGAVIGVIIALTSFLLLQLINPELVTLRIPFLQPVDKIVQSSFFCSGSESTSGADFKILNGGGELECGKEYAVPNSASAASQGKPVMCMGDFCGGNTGAVCSPLSGLNKYECILPHQACEQEKPKSISPDSWCPFIDSIMAASTDPEVKTQACRKTDLQDKDDKCTVGSILHCQTNEIRIDCSYGATEEHPSTVCWDKNKPRTYDPALARLFPGVTGLWRPANIYRPTCQSLSETRAAQGSDAVCCLENSPDKITCHPFKPPLNVVEVPCAQVGKTCATSTDKCWATEQFRVRNDGFIPFVHILPIFLQ